MAVRTSPLPHSAVDLNFIPETVSFINGVKPLSEWDSYRSKLESIGLINLLDVVQEAYDDFMAE